MFFEGLTSLQMNQFEKAEANLKASLAIAREQDDLYTELGLLNLTGWLCIRLGRYDNATTVFERALTLAQKLKTREFELRFSRDDGVGFQEKTLPCDHIGQRGCQHSARTPQQHE